MTRPFLESAKAWLTSARGVGFGELFDGELALLPEAHQGGDEVLGDGVALDDGAVGPALKQGATDFEVDLGAGAGAPT